MQCYYFPHDPRDKDQITFYWKSRGEWDEITTPAVSLISLKHDLEPFIEQSVHSIIAKAIDGPYETGRLFFIAYTLAEKKPLIRLLLKMHTALVQLKTGWFITGEETMESPFILDPESPLYGQRVAPATLQRQLSHLLEKLLANWQRMASQEWMKIKRARGGSEWAELFVIAWLMLHIEEQDVQRLKIHCEQQGGVRLSKQDSSTTDNPRKISGGILFRQLR